MSMVHQDTLFHSFWSDHHLTDLCNALFYGGKQIIHPSLLQDMDSNVSAVLEQGAICRYILKEEKEKLRKAYGGRTIDQRIIQAVRGFLREQRL